MTNKTHKNTKTHDDMNIPKQQASRDTSQDKRNDKRSAGSGSDAEKRKDAPRSDDHHSGR